MNASETSRKPLRIGVIGTGVMGNFHIKNYAAMDKNQVVLAGVYDVDKTRAETIANEYDTVAYSNLEELADNIDAASVVTTSVTHKAVGEVLLGKQIPCLIEKPLAVTKEECLELIDIATKANVILQVGHVELFNPAVIKLCDILNEREPEIHFMNTARIGKATVSGRINDVSVIADLMVHDIYVIQELIGSNVTSVYATGYDKGMNFASSSLHFENGAYATLTASRMAQNRSRTLDVYTDIGKFHLDYVEQTLSLQKDEEITDFTITKGFSLEKELLDFVSCVQEKRTPFVTGDKALKALEVVWAAENSLRTGS